MTLLEHLLGTNRNIAEQVRDAYTDINEEENKFDFCGTFFSSILLPPLMIALWVPKSHI